jgi:DNA primase
VSGREFDETPIFPILDILHHYGGDGPSSQRQWAPCRCPFHGDDRNPSATVNVQAQRFMCHVCMERSEDAIGLVMQNEQLEFKDAVEFCQGISTAINDPLRGSARKQRGISSLFE